MTTYTLDAQLSNGAYASDSGLSADDVTNARANAERLGITILSVVEDAPVSVADLTPFGIKHEHEWTERDGFKSCECGDSRRSPHSVG